MKRRRSSMPIINRTFGLMKNDKEEIRFSRNTSSNIQQQLFNDDSNNSGNTTLVNADLDDESQSSRRENIHHNTNNNVFYSSQQSNYSVPSLHNTQSNTNTSALVISNNNNNNGTTSYSDSSVTKRSSSKLFATDVETTTNNTTTTSTQSSILAPETQFPSDNNNNNNGDGNNNNNNKSLNNKITNNNKPSTLFGAVMKNVHNNNNNNNIPTTPSKSISNVLANTPSGYKLQNFLNEMDDDSPFVNKSLRTPQTTASSNSNMSNSNSSTAFTPRTNIDWHEGYIDSTDGYFGLIDWSIKSVLEFEGTNFKNLDNNHEMSVTTQQQALQQFVTSGCSTNGDYDASVNWNTGLLYWQHPATYPLPAECFTTTTKSSKMASENKYYNTQSNNSTKQKQFLSSSSSHLVRSASMPPPAKRKAHKQQTAFVAHNNTETKEMEETVIDIRVREWRIAFRSLFFIWLNRIDTLANKWNNNNNINEKLIHEINDTYFYSIGYGYTILFRIGINNNNSNTKKNGVGSKSTTISNNSNDVPPQLIPEILISSSSLAFREKLRSMGVTLMLLDRFHEINNNGKEFDEDTLNRALKKKKNPLMSSMSNNNNESPTVKSDLIALRRANTVGADFSVNVVPKNNNNNSNNNNNNRSSKLVPPVYINGIDDCMSFYEIYINTLGNNIQTGSVQRTSVQANDLSHDVPLLLCRKLGPFLHGSIKQVSTKRKKQIILNNEEDSGINNNGCGDSITVRGIILPCAVRDLFCAAASSMLHQSSQNNNSRTDDEESCNIVVKASLNEGNDVMQTAIGIIGNHNSKGFNSAECPFSKYLRRKDGYRLISSQYCHFNESILLAVWDSTSSNTLVYKLNHHHHLTSSY